MQASVKKYPCLVIFCRRPAPGSGKRRLAAEIGERATAEVARLLLAAAIEDAQAWPGPVAVAPAHDRDIGWAKTLLRRDHCAVVAQPPGNLGKRIQHVDQQLRIAGARGTVFIGSDAPVLQPSDYADALRGLERHGAVLTPATDGGVTLMGSAGAWPELSSLPWGTDQLGDALFECCTNSGLSTLQLTERYDVDHAEDLHRLLDDLAGDPRPARVSLLDWIRRWQGAGI